MKREYYDCTAQGVFFPATLPCEHCDGERSNLVREDALRGRVCDVCDSSLDEMLNESPNVIHGMAR